MPFSECVLGVKLCMTVFITLLKMARNTFPWGAITMGFYREEREIGLDSGYDKE